MLGLAFLFLSALTIALYIGWICLLAWVGTRVVRKALSPTARVSTALLGVLLALLPISGALVRPLMENACDERGRIVQMEEAPKGDTSLLVTGRHYGFFHAIDLLANRQLSSLHLGAGSEFGDARRIAHAAEVIDGHEFSLRLSKPDDLSCGPYYDMLERTEYSPKGYSGLCVAYANDPLPETYLRASGLHRREWSWRTAFYPIDWTGVRLERVSPAGTTSVLELREFDHHGTGFPLLLNLTPIGKVSCRADKNIQDAIASVLAPNPVHHEPEAYSKEQLAKQVELLEERFWGVPIPKKARLYDVYLWDNEYAKNGRGPEVILDVHDHDLPVLLKVSSNVDVNWSISRQSADQIVLLKPSPPGRPPHVQGVPDAYVLSGDKDRFAGSPLVKFYLRKVTFGVEMRSITEKRYCKLYPRPTGKRFTIQVNGCPAEVSDPRRLDKPVTGAAESQHAK